MTKCLIIYSITCSSGNLFIYIHNNTLLTTANYYYRLDFAGFPLNVATLELHKWEHIFPSQHQRVKAVSSLVTLVILLPSHTFTNLIHTAAIYVTLYTTLPQHHFVVFISRSAAITVFTRNGKQRFRILEYFMRHHHCLLHAVPKKPSPTCVPPLPSSPRISSHSLAVILSAVPSLPSSSTPLRKYFTKSCFTAYATKTMQSCFWQR